MTALPPSIPAQLQRNPKVATAYSRCLGIENSLQHAANSGKSIGKDLIYVRIVGYLIYFVPSEEGRENIVSEINSCQGDSELIGIGQMYYDHYIRPFRASKRGTPTSSNHPSPPTFDTLADMLNDALIPATPSCEMARKKALARDGYRCVLSGDCDETSYDGIPALQEKVNRESNFAETTPTECAHIFSQSTNMDIESSSAKRDYYAASMWAIMDRFGYKSLPDELNGPKIHRLENVMTLNRNLHASFDNLKIWLVETNKKNRYKVECSRPQLPRGCAPFVTFTTPDPVNLPLPSPTYLAIHAACAKVAHLSGATEAIAKFDRDMEDGTTLDPNGVSAGMLEEALRVLRVAVCSGSMIPMPYGIT